MTYREEDKLVFKIDSEFRSLFRKIIKSRLLLYPSIPAEWEDIYMMFLKEVKKFSEDFDPDGGVAFHTYLGRKCKYFAMNECRRLSTGRYSILNKSVPIDNFFSLEDVSTRVEIPLDLSAFSEMENNIYHLYFIQEAKMIDISNELQLSMHKIRVAVKSIKLKILTQLRN